MARTDDRRLGLPHAAAAAIAVLQGRAERVVRRGHPLPAFETSTRGVASIGVPAVRGGRIRRLGLVCLAVVLAAAGFCGGWAAWLRLAGNIHEVEAGVYRSAQPSPALILAFVRDHQVRTVLNLRGGHPGEDWFDAEAGAVQQAGARLISIRLSATREPDDGTLTTLLETLRTAERPLLIHCYSGADRAGLASALYALTVAHRPAALAAEQLSFRYGHFPWLTSRTGAMDRAFWRVAGAAP